MTLLILDVDFLLQVLAFTQGTSATSAQLSQCLLCRGRLVSLLDALHLRGLTPAFNPAGVSYLPQKIKSVKYQHDHLTEPKLSFLAIIHWLSK